MAVSRGVTRLVPIPDNLPPSDNKVENEWRYSSSPRVTLMASVGISLHRDYPSSRSTVQALNESPNLW